MFGVLNAIARLLVGVSSDLTRHTRYGGPTTYIVASLLLFAIGLLCLVFPGDVDAMTMQIANGFIALGYGGMMGMVPIALRLQFGTAHIGMLCGILYALVSVAQPIWSLLASSSGECTGVACYATYNAGGAAGCVAAASIGCGLMVANSLKETVLAPTDPSGAGFLQDPHV
jgi:MFS family permease